MRKIGVLVIFFTLSAFILQLKTPLSSLTIHQIGESVKAGTLMIGQRQIQKNEGLNRGTNTKENIDLTDEEIITFKVGDMPPEEVETREVVAGNLADGNIDTAITQLEQYWENHWEHHFETVFSETQITADASRKALSTLAKETGKKPGIIYVFAQPKELKIVLFTAEGKPIYKNIPQVSRQELFKVLRSFLTEVTNPRRTLTTSYLPDAQQLYKWIIAPIEPDIQAQKIDTLIFALDGDLRSLPVAALHDGKQFLVEKYIVCVTPNFNLMDKRFSDLKNAKILAMGASRFQDQNPLPAVPLELSTIVEEQDNRTGNGVTANRQKGLWPGKRFLNENFTLENLKEERRKDSYKIIHLATHGEFKPDQVNNSYIQFFNSKLSIDKMRQLQLNNPVVELMVLSACKTAVGDHYAQLGFAGMAVQSGAKTVVASLWYVNDQGTLALMTEFYQHLKTAPIKAEALRQAQIAMLSNQVTVNGGQLRGTRGENLALPAELTTGVKINLSHPYYWSAFTMIGSPW